MALGACVASRLHAGLDARKLVLVTEFVLLPVTLLMTGLVALDVAQIWMVYPFQLAYGFGGMVNMTAQRELLLWVGGPYRSTRVLNAEVTLMASAMMLGPVTGGISIAASGLGVAFGVLAALLSVSLALLWTATRRIPVQEPIVGGVKPVVSNGIWQLLRRSRALVAILAVTVICNLCYFAFIPLVPVIAKSLDAGAMLAGVIGSTAGMVQLAVSAALVVRPLRRPLTGYAVGVALCLGGLAVLAYAPVMTVALIALGVAGIGQGLFGSTQATLPVAAVAPHERAAAFGLLSTTIGVALPAGMVLLGLTSGLLGARPAMLLSALVGLVVLVVVGLGNRRLLQSFDAAAVSGAAAGVGGERNPVATQTQLGQRAWLPGVVGDDVFEPDQRGADLDPDQFGGLWIGGDRADSGAAAADAQPQLLFEDQQDIRGVDVSVETLAFADGDVVDGDAQR